MENVESKLQIQDNEIGKMNKRVFGIYICKAHHDNKDKFPNGFIHQLHRLTGGRLLINHIEPDGSQAVSMHKKDILCRVL